jgi:clan AA aspartic protease
MSSFREDITLKNIGDMVRVKDGHLKAADARQVTVKALVDTGAWTLAIPEAIRAQLGLELESETSATFGDGYKTKCQVTETLKVCWKNRSMGIEAVVVPGADEVLMGALVLEGMDLMVNPVAEEVVGVHGDKMECIMK